MGRCHLGSPTDETYTKSGGGWRGPSAALRLFMGYTLAVRWAGLFVMTMAMACAGSSRSKVSTLVQEPTCSAGQRYDGTACIQPSDARAKVAEAKVALANFDVDKALPLLDAAASSGPHERELLIALYEQRGIAYSYLKREEDAMKAFGSLLDLDPGHLLSYTLSPQATFLYERARTQNQKRARALVNVSWPQGLREDQSIPLVVEVLSDPASMLKRMALYVRSSDKVPYQRVALTLPNPGELSTLHLPAPNTDKPAVLQLYGRAYDGDGDEVLLWFDEGRPREIPLAYDAGSPWYRKWWVWAAIGGAVAVGTGTTVYLLGLDPADRVGGVFTVGD